MAITIGSTIPRVVPTAMITVLETHSNKWGCTVQFMPAIAHALSATATRIERIANFSTSSEKPFGNGRWGSVLKTPPPVAMDLWLRSLTQFLTKYQWLLDTYVIVRLSSECVLG